MTRESRFGNGVLRRILDRVCYPLPGDPTQDPGPCRGPEQWIPPRQYKAVECLLIASIESAFYIIQLLPTKYVPVVTVLEAQGLYFGWPHPLLVSRTISIRVGLITNVA